MVACLRCARAAGEARRVSSPAACAVCHASARVQAQAPVRGAALGVLAPGALAQVSGALPPFGRRPGGRRGRISRHVRRPACSPPPRISPNVFNSFFPCSQRCAALLSGVGLARRESDPRLSL